MLKAGTLLIIDLLADRQNSQHGFVFIPHSAHPALALAHSKPLGARFRTPHSRSSRRRFEFPGPSGGKQTLDLLEGLSLGLRHEPQDEEPGERAH